jgi:glycosyltransferase involved in cell wall biosynthesis
MKCTVILPCYNSTAYVGEAIRSVLAQTLPAYETIVVDDGSTDDTVRVVKGFTGIQVVQQPNAGPSRARNTGIDAASGDVIAFLDADDRWDADKLRRQAQLMEQQPEVGLVHAASRIIDSASRVTQDRAPVMGTPARGRAPVELIDHNTIRTSSVLMTRAALGTDRFDESTRHGEDWDLWLRLAERTAIGYISDVLVDYRRHAANTINDEYRMALGRVQVLEKAVNRLTLDDPRGAITRRHYRTALRAAAYYSYQKCEYRACRQYLRRLGWQKRAADVALYAATWVGGSRAPRPTPDKSAGNRPG